MLLEKLGNIKDMILEQVKDFVITKIITAGITWLIGLLNPAAAFIKACKLIYDVVMFFVNNAERIMKFVNTIIDSVADIVRGNVSSVVNKINDVLGQMVPILIGFLASVIGIGGIGQKIRQIVETLQKPVNNALDFVIKTGLKLAGPIIRGIKGFAGKVKAGAKKLGQKALAKVRGGDDSPEGKQKRLDAAMLGSIQVANRFSGKVVASKAIQPLLVVIRTRYGLSRLDVVADGPTWAVEGEINPRARKSTKAQRGKDRTFSPEGEADKGVALTRASVDSAIDRDVERAFTEWDGPAEDPSFPVARRPAATAEKRDARADFSGRLRGESVDKDEEGSGSGFA
jgi:hypothetical protein